MNMSITSNQRPFILLGLIAFGLVTCQKKATSPEYNNPYDETSTAYVPTPNLNTAPVSDILALSAKSGGTFENDYGKPVTAKGVCWSLTENPTVGGSCTNEGPNTTSFASNLTGLLADTLYYVRAYATNEAGTIYGGQRIFRTKDGIATFGEVKTMSVLAKSATLWMVVTGDGTAPITRKGFVWAEGSTPTLADSVASFGEGIGSATKVMTALKPGTEYHMRAFTESAARVTYSAPVVFTTQTGQPQFSGLSVSAVTSASSTISVTIDADGGDGITARGVCYSMQSDPTTADTCVSAGSGTGSYSVNLIGLEKATAYFVRPYATNTVITGYGAQVSFVTSAVLPTVTTGSVSGLGANTATVSGEVTSDGGSPQTNRGICYATSQTPTIANTCVASGTGAGAFESTLTGLSMGTTYYARAYATNPIGTTYGSQVNFTTLTGPTVTTGAVSNLSSISAMIEGNVSADGGSTVTTRGVCYSTMQSPTTSDACISAGSGMGAFTAALSGLTRGTTYYVRAYATNAVATSYGGQVSLTTHDVPTVTTGAISAITSTSATVAGNVTAEGGVTVTARGICYSTSQNPTTSGTCITSGSMTGSFTAALSGLTFATSYYVRAYATNSVGTSYGAQSNFTTLAVLPTVATGAITNITASGAMVAGDVTATGGATVTARGVCYSTSQNPTTSGTCTTSGGGSGSFNALITGLLPAITYFTRAYATNSVGTTYGTEINFTTNASPPDVTANTIIVLSSSSATVYANVLAANGASVIDRGVCYSKFENPSLSNSCISTSNGIGEFQVTIENLESATSYFVRAYAENAIGINYSSQLSFTTSGTAAITDIDGNRYPTIQIGNRVWMASNLRTSRFSNGDIISNVPNAQTWRNYNEGAWVNYSNNPSYDAVYGKLYNWYAAADNRNLCPVGWHVPSDEEWGQLWNYLIPDAGYKMKTTSGWKSFGNGNNQSGFSGLPGGERSESDGTFYSIEDVAKFWSSTNYGDSGAWIWELSSRNSLLERRHAFSKSGFSVRCIQNGSLSSVVTVEVISVDKNTAQVIGDVLSKGADAVKYRGFVWGKSSNPTLESNNGSIYLGSGNGQFSGNLSGLTSGTTYQIRAFATNSSGTAYGNQLSFTTLGTAPVTDIDGNVYQTVQIGTQVWMAANLKTTRYRDGTSIPNVTNGTTWSGLTTDAWASYDNTTANNTTYGKLYNWYAVADSRKLCPTGWHVPSDAEWTLISDYLGIDPGHKMKSISGWNNNGNGSNTSGFNGLPGGARSSGGAFGEIGTNGYFWSSSEGNFGLATSRNLGSENPNLGRNNLGSKSDGFSVRCIRD